MYAGSTSVTLDLLWVKRFSEKWSETLCSFNFSIYLRFELLQRIRGLVSSTSMKSNFYPCFYDHGMYDHEWSWNIVDDQLLPTITHLLASQLHLHLFCRLFAATESRPMIVPQKWIGMFTYMWSSACANIN